jgi:hypothetical protein
MINVGDIRTSRLEEACQTLPLALWELTALLRAVVAVIGDVAD